MTKENLSFDLLEQKLLKKKYNQLFWSVGNIYNQPKTIKELINCGIATKIARQFDHHTGFYQYDRDFIAKQLCQIDFSVFLLDQKDLFNSENLNKLRLHKKVFPSNNNLKRTEFIRKVLKFLCRNASIETLNEIYRKNLSFKVSKIENELRKTMLVKVSKHATFLNLLKSLYKGPEFRKNFVLARELKNKILNEEYTVTSNNLDDNEEHLTLMVNMFKSVAKTAKNL